MFKNCITVVFNTIILISIVIYRATDKSMRGLSTVPTQTCGDDLPELLGPVVRVRDRPVVDWILSDINA